MGGVVLLPSGSAARPEARAGSRAAVSSGSYCLSSAEGKGLPCALLERYDGYRDQGTQQSEWQIQNTHTGLDLSVPEHQEIRGKMMSGHVEYHIVVVTRLAAFKSAKHKPEDVVQFMVSKKYSEIEELYHRLAARYPQASLPLLPRKVLFVGESDICERRAMFNDIMKSISKDEDLATSPELLEFLGTKSTSVIDFKSKNIPDDKEKEDEESEALDFFKEEKTPDLISQLASAENAKKGQKKEEEEEEEEEEVLDPLGIIRYG
nr:PREDICTED: HCLS1-binding protein 3-like [Apteryx mantelli mantelli]